MFSKQNTLIEQNKRSNNIQRLFSATILIFFIATFALTLTMAPTFASGMGGSASSGALNQVMDTVLGIIKTASLYVGIIVILWGVFQIILALRREDSESVSKQIITIVVGGVLVGFGTLADQLYAALT